MTLRGGVVLMTFLSLIGMGWLSQALSPAQDGKVGRVIRPSPARLKTNPLVREPAGLPRRPYGPDSRGRGRWPDRARITRARAADQMPRPAALRFLVLSAAASSPWRLTSASIARTVLLHRVARARLDHRPGVWRQLASATAEACNRS